MMDLVSVIVPIYNVEKYLKDCVDSIIKQTYTCLEILLVDDGSTDSCGALCEEYKKKDRRVTVIHKKNGGLSDARNAGLDICQGDYIAFIDSDDIVSEHFIEYLYNTIKSENVDIATLKKTAKFWDDGIRKPVFNDGMPYDTSTIDSTQALALMYYQVIPTGIPHKLYKRFLFDTIRFPKGYLYEDLATSYKLFMKASRLSIISPILYGYRMRMDSFIRRDFREDKMIIISIGDKLYEDTMEFNLSLEHAAACRVFSAISSVFLQAPLNDKNTIKRLWDSMKKYRDIVIRERKPEMRDKIWYCAKMMTFGMRITHIIGRKFGRKGSFN